MVKFECTSTFPRLICLVKFLPVLQGIGLVYVYNEKRISRRSEKEKEKEDELKNYKEFKYEYYNVLIEGETKIDTEQLEHADKLLEVEDKLMKLFSMKLSKADYYFCDGNITYFDPLELEIITNALLKPVSSEREVIDLIDEGFVSYYKGKKKEDKETEEIKRINSTYFKKELLFERIDKTDEKSFTVVKKEKLFERPPDVSLSMSKIDNFSQITILKGEEHDCFYLKRLD